MTMEECYQALEGDYNGIMSRLRSEAFIKKFLGKFLDDESYQNIHKYLNEKNIPEAFRAAHTLKGVCQNLSLDRLFQSSQEVTEALRSGEDHTTPEMIERLDADYKQTVSAIRKFLEI